MQKRTPYAQSVPAGDCQLARPKKSSSVAYTWLKHDGLLKDRTLMRVELIYASRLSIQAKDVIEKSVPISPVSAMKEFYLLTDIVPKTSCSIC